MLKGTDTKFYYYTSERFIEKQKDIIMYPKITDYEWKGSEIKLIYVKGNIVPEFL